MVSFFFGGFGLSTLWLLPLLWRHLRPLISRRRPAFAGNGTIRFWLGGALVLLSSAGLEGLVVSAFTDDPNAGGSVCRALASMFAGPAGTFLATIVLVAVLCAALPWYLGGTWARWFTAATHALESAFAVVTHYAGRWFIRPNGRGRRQGAVRRQDRTPSRRATVAAGKLPAAPLREHIEDISDHWPTRRAAPRAETLISEPWLLPKSAKEALPLASAKVLPRTTLPVRGPVADVPVRVAGASGREMREASTALSGKNDGAIGAALEGSATPSSVSEGGAVPLVAIGTVGATAGASSRMPDALDAARDNSQAAVAARQLSGDTANPTDAARDSSRDTLQATTDVPAPPNTRPAVSEALPGFDPAVARSAWPPESASHTSAVDVTLNRWSSPVAPSIPRDAANDETPIVTPTRAPLAVSVAPLRAAPVMGLPPLNLLARSTLIEPTLIDEANLQETGELIEQRLREFKVPVTVVGASAGPVITRFEVEPAVGVRGNQIVALMKDLARGLGRTSIRVVETIPGKTCMGLELPNEKRQMIALSEILDSAEYRNSDSLLTLAMGKGITGEPVVADLARAPHMLVAGTTGSGKSVAINAMILSLLYKATPEDVRMIMIDPKMLELSVYEGIPHLLAPVVTDMKLAANALNWCVAEMENRYRVMSDLRVRNLAGFNEKVREARANGRPLMNPFPAHPEIPELLDTLPMIVVVIDELADLMMVAGKKIEELIARLAQKARAAGIHLVLATQRPSVDVITGLIKANIPTRVAFQVSSKIDSRTILDQMGAESLLGQGDMLFLPPGTGYPQRIHGAFVADEEVHRVVAWLKQFGEPDYKDEILAGPLGEGSGELFGEESTDAELDPLYDEAAAFVLRSRRASISFVQRQFRIGYNRAARLVEAMEAAGLVSSMGINGQREVLAPGPSE